MKMAVAAFFDGALRVIRAPTILAGLFVVLLLVSVPASHLVRIGIASSLGNSRVADDMALGVNLEWWDHYLETATGLGRTFTPHVIGFAAVLDNTSRVLDNRTMAPAVAALAAGFLLAWLFLSGGIIDRLARNRPVQALGFFSACGVYFFRFLRLSVIAALGYWVLFGPVHGFLFGTIFGAATADLTVERTAFFVRLGLYLVFGGLLVVWTLLLDYARIRTVVEDRRSMLGAMFAGSRFAIRHPKKTGLLWAANALALLVVVGVYGVVAPGVTDPGGIEWAAFAIGQIYMVARLFLKLLTYASEASLFQAMQAHASYRGAPLPLWPDSPAVEAIVQAADVPQSQTGGGWPPSSV